MNVSPLARSWKMVTMKLTEPRSDDVIRKTMPRSQNVCPWVAMTDSGGYEVQPEFGGAARERGSWPASAGRPAGSSQ